MRNWIEIIVVATLVASSVAVATDNPFQERARALSGFNLMSSFGRALEQKMVANINSFVTALPETLKVTIVTSQGDSADIKFGTKQFLIDSLKDIDEKPVIQVKLDSLRLKPVEPNGYIK